MRTSKQAAQDAAALVEIIGRCDTKPGYEQAVRKAIGNLPSQTRKIGGKKALVLGIAIGAFVVKQGYDRELIDRAIVLKHRAVIAWANLRDSQRDDV